ncbi:MAG: Ger(x)C family spore germination protein [Paenibacillaceae bacterium]|uniref:Ger(X)C family spore germination protein n=1 Tax=Paenibacillus mellifer TaxID=2937794 RepID=A0A9X1XZT0_9BACL|nr:Ger(x)C family spore germination protein [Paenibacillus mellifer]MBW4838585.1 Ger(x)C family spore germination protein [Paenibacillaceae bacterium]MCK8486956.1 Ger(x)C family spore germination protein [Paenibacillus mellifer]
MRRYRAGMLVLLTLPILATGCWDRVEIEERGFVVGAGIDVAEEEQAENGKYLLTFQFVDPGGLQSKVSGGKGGSKGEAYFNLSSAGNTMFTAARNMSYRTSRSPYLQHNRLILISEELALRGEFVKTLDLFLRDHEMRRATKVMVAEGKASELLKVKPKNEKIPIMYFESTAENPPKSSRIYPPTNIGDVQSFILSKTSFALPKLSKLEDEVSVSGSAVFDGASQTLKGFLNDQETSGLNILRGTAMEGVLEFKMNDDYLAYEIKGLKRKIRADVSDPEHIRFTLFLEMEGNIGETQDRINLLKQYEVSEIEQKTADELFKLTTSTIERVQQNFKVDVIGLGDYLKQQHYSVWKKIKDNWDRGDNIFAQSEIVVEARAEVRNVGSTVETK